MLYRFDAIDCSIVDTVRKLTVDALTCVNASITLMRVPVGCHDTPESVCGNRDKVLH